MPKERLQPQTFVFFCLFPQIMVQHFPRYVLFPKKTTAKCTMEENSTNFVGSHNYFMWGKKIFQT